MIREDSSIGESSRLLSTWWIMPLSSTFFSLGTRYRGGMNSSRLCIVCIRVIQYSPSSLFLVAMIYVKDRVHKKPWKCGRMNALPPHA